MKIYLDNDFRCHLENDGTMIEYDSIFFDNKCKAFIEGYRCVPAGYTWTNQYGETFNGGEMIAPAIDHDILTNYQEQYEISQAEHLEEIGQLIEEIYLNDVEVIENV